MADIPLPADDFQIGDIVHGEDGSRTEIRALQRGDLGKITVNPGDFDEIIGYIWHTAVVTRPDQEDTMTAPAERLTLAADRLDHLYEGAKHIPVDMYHSEEKRGLVTGPEQTIRGAVAQFFWGGAAEVFLTLGPAVLPLLAKLLRAEVKSVKASESIHGILTRPSGDQPNYLESTVAALALADHILSTKEK